MLMELFTAYVGSVLEKAVDKPPLTPVHKGWLADVCISECSTSLYIKYCYVCRSLYN